MKDKKIYRISVILITIFVLSVPVIELIFHKSNYSNISSFDYKNQLYNSDVNAILWKFGQGLIGTGPSMQPRLVRFTEGGEQFIIVGTDGGLAVITKDGYTNMTYVTFNVRVNVNFFYMKFFPEHTNINLYQ